MSEASGSSAIDFAIRRTPIAKFTFQGEVFDFDGDGYEIDNMHRVFGKSGREIAKNYANVTLCHNGVPTPFDKVRLYHAVVNPLLPTIEAASGIRTLDRNLPDTDCAKFAWETPADRANRVELNRYVINCRENEWRVLAYADETFETFERFELYEVNSWTGDIRNERTKKVLKPDSDGKVKLCRRDGTFASIYGYRAYMCTFKVYARETDQTHVDHIDGNHLNNHPSNFRWASPSENARYKFAKKAKQKTLEKFTGNLNTLKQFRDSGWYMGLDEGTDEYVIVRSSTNDKYRVGDFGVTSRHPYPVIGVGNSLYKVHRVVAYVEEIISKYEFENPKTCGFVVMHIDNDKEDFRPEKLKRGTPGDNNMARHDNPETSGRKVVRQLDLNRVCIKEFPSITAAALDTGIHPDTISGAVKYGRKCQGKFYFEFVV